MSTVEMSDFDRSVFEIIKDYEGMKLPFVEVARALNISTEAFWKSKAITHLKDGGAIVEPGGYNSRVYFIGSTPPTNWKRVVKRAILDAVVVEIKLVEGKPHMHTNLRNVLTSGPENFRLKDQ